MGAPGQQTLVGVVRQQGDVLLGSLELIEVEQCEVQHGVERQQAAQYANHAPQPSTHVETPYSQHSQKHRIVGEGSERWYSNTCITVVCRDHHNEVHKYTYMYNVEYTCTCIFPGKFHEFEAKIASHSLPKVMTCYLVISIFTCT